MTDNATRSHSRPPPWLALAALALGASFAVWRGQTLLPAVFGDETPVGVRILLGCQWLVEATFAFGIAGTTVLGLAYLLLPRRRAPTIPCEADPANVSDAETARIAILYLCCGDLDDTALDSLQRLRHAGSLELWIHDDQPGGDPRVDAAAAQIRSHGDMPVHVLRRPVKAGGKPGAVNYVLDQMADRCDFVLLCDNDSIAQDPDCLREMLAPMADPRVAVVQARNVPVVDESVCSVNRVASRAIDVFHLFLEVGSRLAWTPFVGHNALLRTTAVRAVGGMQPGCFADDIDLTLRLQLAGHRVHYAGTVAFGERHPPNYAAFRKRAYKWACGSSQVLRRWLLPALRSKQLGLAEKWGFVQFLGFYSLQSLALVYTAMMFLIAPLVLSREWFPAAATVLAGTFLPLLIFLPVLAFALRRGWWRGLPSFLMTCWLCYGAADFPTARGTLHGLSNKARRWIPTNGVRGGADRSMLLEALFGVAILVVPLWRFPELLLSPLTFLIATKFLLLPTIGELYQDGVRPRHVPRLLPMRLHTLMRIGLVILCLGVLPAQSPAPSTTPSASAVEVRGDQLLVDDEPYVVKGLHYGPWRPGTGPGRSPYPSRAELAEDLALIAELHANTIFTFDPPRELLDVAWSSGVRVLCGFWLEWPQFGTPAFAAKEDEAVETVKALRDHPAILGWVLGNEIPSWVVTQNTAPVVEDRLRALHARVRATDPGHPVTHANWPTTRSLDLSFFEICAFNVYPLWPPEVVARGYGNFINDVLRPIAQGRPLLITEFGANTIEAGVEGQARLAGECWRGLRSAGAIGGFVFEFADEWWKNYSNPKMSGAWWDRDTALDDHLRHDEDPEEHYGLFDAERRAKPASRAVAQMYGASEDLSAPPAPLPETRSTGSPEETRPTYVVLLVIAGAVGLYMLTARMRSQDRRRAAGSDEPPPTS